MCIKVSSVEDIDVNDGEKGVPIYCWNDFIKRVEEIKCEYLELKEQIKKEPWYGYPTVSYPIYRGQPDIQLSLKTTLERECEKRVTLENYLDRAKEIYFSMENRPWDLGGLDPSKEHFEEPNLKIFEFFARLRHMGHPSPLLDWTRSPYIAAYFAFRNIGSQDIKEVAIYVYREYVAWIKGYENMKPHIKAFGRSIQTHPRQSSQEAEYTYCIIEIGDGKNTQRIFSNHEDVFKKNFKNQDRLKIFRLSVALQKEFLAKLGEMNINEHFLFDS